jgi:hypothetical protein
MGMIFDVSGKLFGNLFYPTQTQIHLEMESKAKRDRRIEFYQENGVRMRRGRRTRSSHNAAAALGSTDNV